MWIIIYSNFEVQIVNTQLVVYDAFIFGPSIVFSTDDMILFLTTKISQIQREYNFV